MNNISVVIPTHYRHVFLSRVLDYYKNSKFKIYVADSSKKIFKDRFKYENLTYLHFPEDLYFRKMQKVFSYVNTKYTFICADDDFVSIESAKKCALYLEENQDYSSAQGHYVGFNYHSSLNPFPYYLNMINLDVSDNSPFDRISNQLDKIPHLYYSICRTNFLKYFFEEISPKLSNISSNMSQHANTIASLIEGKHRVLPIFYCARDASTSVPGNIRGNQHLDFEEIQQQNKNYYKVFIDVLAIFCSKKHSISQQEAKQNLEKILHKYIETTKNLSNKKISTKSNLLKVLIRKIIPPLVIDKFKKKIYKKKTKGAHGFPFNDKESELQWQEMKNVICMHNINYSKSVKEYLSSWYY